MIKKITRVLALSVFPMIGFLAGVYGVAKMNVPLYIGLPAAMGFFSFMFWVAAKLTIDRKMKWYGILSAFIFGLLLGSMLMGICWIIREVPDPWRDVGMFMLLVLSGRLAIKSDLFCRCIALMLGAGHKNE